MSDQVNLPRNVLTQCIGLLYRRNPRQKAGSVTAETIRELIDNAKPLWNSEEWIIAGSLVFRIKHNCLIASYNCPVLTRHAEKRVIERFPAIDHIHQVYFEVLTGQGLSKKEKGLYGIRHAIAIKYDNRVYIVVEEKGRKRVIVTVINAKNFAQQLKEDKQATEIECGHSDCEGKKPVKPKREEWLKEYERAITQLTNKSLNPL